MKTGKRNVNSVSALESPERNPTNSPRPQTAGRDGSESPPHRRADPPPPPTPIMQAAFAQSLVLAEKSRALGRLSCAAIYIEEPAKRQQIAIRALIDADSPPEEGKTASNQAAAENFCGPAGPNCPTCAPRKQLFETTPRNFQNGSLGKLQAQTTLSHKFL